MHAHTARIPISVPATAGTLQKLEQITPLCACSHSDCCYIQIGFQVASCVLQRPVGLGPARYTWGLLPESTEARVQPVAPLGYTPGWGGSGPYPLHSPQHAHFHHHLLRFITVMGPSGVYFPGKKTPGAAHGCRWTGIGPATVKAATSVLPFFREQKTRHKRREVPQSLLEVHLAEP